MGYYDLVVNDIPLGLLSISRYVKDYNIIIVDQRIKGWEKKLEEALKLNPLAIGFTVTTGGQIGFALGVSKIVKEKYNKLPVIWGGIHPTLLPEETLKNPCIDIVVASQAEFIFPRLLRALEKNELHTVPGIFYKEEGLIRQNQITEDNIKLDNLEFLPYQLIQFENYTNHAHYKFGNVLSIETGRGCPHRCVYCYNSTVKRRQWQIMSPERIIEHIQHLKKYTGFDGINFVDDDFFINKERVFKLLQLLKKEKKKFYWGCETGIRDLLGLDKTFLKELEDSGLRWILLGAESGSEKILQKIGKKLKVNEITELNKRLKKYNFYPMYNFMNGYIWEDINDLKKSSLLILQLLKDNKKANIQTFHIVVPYPGTRYLEVCINEGLTKPKQLEEWIDYNPDDWIDYSPWLDKKQKDLLKTLYIASIYIDKKIYINVMERTILAILIKFFRLVYYPIAWLRFRFCSGAMAIENRIFYGFKKYSPVLNENKPK